MAQHTTVPSDELRVVKSTTPNGGECVDIYTIKCTLETTGHCSDDKKQWIEVDYYNNGEKKKREFY